MAMECVPELPAGTDMLNRIEALKHELSKAERKVAEQVLADPEAVITTAIASLAHGAGVSEPTVIRFCRALGCKGYQEFKLRLAQGLVTGVPFIHANVGPDDDARQLVTKLFDSAIATLARVRERLDPGCVQRAIDLLAEAHRIEFYGHGASGVVATDAQHKFFRLGVPTVAYSDPHVHAMSAATLEPGAVVVAISHTGRSRDIITSVRIALEGGATVVGITAAGSPLAELCTVVVAPGAGEDTRTFIPMGSRIADLAVVDTLAVGVALQRGPKLGRRLEKTKQILADKHLY